METTDPQLKNIRAAIRPTKSGKGEVFVFTIPLGFMSLVCIVPIPDDDVNDAPVYIKIKFNSNEVEMPTAVGDDNGYQPRARRSFRRASDTQTDDSSDDQYNTR